MSQYATIADLESLSLPPRALERLSAATKNQHLQAASAKVDGYLRSRHAVPLTSWPDDLTQAVAAIAAWTLVRFRGTDPDGPDAVLKTGHTEAIAYLRDIADGRVTLQVDVTEPAAAELPSLDSDTARGWGD